MEHRNITGLDALHPFAIRQAVDPGAIGADKGWLDTSVAPARWRVRNAANTGWEDPQAQGSSMRAFDTTAARDAFFAAPTGGELAWNRETGFMERRDPVTGRWLGEGHTGTAGPVVTAKAKGAWGDGAHDDRAFLLEMDNAVLATGWGELPPGTYRVDANLQFLGTVRPVRGALLRPNAGVTIDFAGGVDAGIWKFLDKSLGGKFTFSGSRIKVFHAEWWGFIGDDLTDNTPILNGMYQDLPPDAYVHAGTQNGVYRLGGTVINPGRAGVIVDTGRNPGYGDFGAPTLKWVGPAGGIMWVLDRVRFGEVNGFQWDPGLLGAGADTALMWDGYSTYNYLGVVDGTSYGIGSACKAHRNRFGHSQRANWAAIRIAENIVAAGQPNNQEYHHVIQNDFEGPELWKAATVTIAAGNVNFTVNAGGRNWGAGLTAADVGKDVYISGGGAAGDVHHTTIATVIDATHGTLTVAPVTTPPGQTFLIEDQNVGTCVKIANSANAKRIVINLNFMNNHKYAIWQQNGSHHTTENSYFGNTANVLIESASEPTMELGTNTEQSRCHLDNRGGLNHYSVAGRFDPSMCPGKYINDTETGGGHTEYAYPSFDSTPPVGAAIFYSAQIGRLTVRAPNFGSGGIAYERIVHPLSGAINFWDLLNGPLSGLLPETQRSVLATGLAVRAPGVSAFPLKAIGFSNGSSTANSDQFGAIEATLEWINGAGFNYDSPIFRATMLALGKRTWGAPHIIGYDVQMPKMNVGDSIFKVTGVRIVPPTIGGGSSINNGVGVEIGDMKTAGVGGNPLALSQLGPNDFNDLLGKTKFGANGVRFSRRRFGTAVLVAGTVVVNDANVTANSVITLTSNVDGGAPGWLRVSARVPGTSFTILSSSATDTSTVGYEIVEP